MKEMMTVGFISKFDQCCFELNFPSHTAGMITLKEMIIRLTGDNAADEDGVSTIVPSTSNEQAPLDKIKCNQLLLDWIVPVDQSANWEDLV
jgi:hypothetical protein